VVGLAGYGIFKLFQGSNESESTIKK
jgi:hypothetical protein